MAALRLTARPAARRASLFAVPFSTPLDALVQRDFAESGRALARGLRASLWPRPGRVCLRARVFRRGLVTAQEGALFGLVEDRAVDAELQAVDALAGPRRRRTARARRWSTTRGSTRGQRPASSSSSADSLLPELLPESDSLPLASWRSGSRRKDQRRAAFGYERVFPSGSRAAHQPLGRRIGGKLVWGA